MRAVSKLPVLLSLLLIVLNIQESLQQENCWSESFCDCKILGQSFCDNSVLNAFKNTWDNAKNSLNTVQAQLSSKTQELLDLQRSLTDVNVKGPLLAQTFKDLESHSEDFAQSLSDNFATFQETADVLLQQLPQLFPLTSESSYADMSKELTKTVQQVFINSILDQALSDTQSCLHDAINNGGISFETYFGLPAPTVGFKIQFERPSLVPCLTEKKKDITQRAIDNWNQLKQQGSPYVKILGGVFDALTVLTKKVKAIQSVKLPSMRLLCDSSVNTTTGTTMSSLLTWLNKISQGVNLYGKSAFGPDGLGQLFSQLKDGVCTNNLHSALLNMTSSILRYYGQGRANSLPAVFDGLFNSMDLSSSRLQSFISSPQSAFSAAICSQPNLGDEIKKVCIMVANTSARTQACFHKYFNLNQMVYHHGIELSLKPFKFVSLQTGYDCKSYDCWLCVNGFKDQKKRSVEETEADETNSLGESTGFWSNSLASFTSASVLPSCDPSTCQGTFNIDTCECQSNGGGLSGGAIAGIVIATIIGVALLVVAGVWFYLKKNNVNQV